MKKMITLLAAVCVATIAGCSSVEDTNTADDDLLFPSEHYCTGNNYECRAGGDGLTESDPRSPVPWVYAGIAPDMGGEQLRCISVCGLNSASQNKKNHTHCDPYEVDRNTIAGRCATSND